MDIRDFYHKEGEKPLDNLVTDGGFCGIFRTIGCVGDSLLRLNLRAKRKTAKSFIMMLLTIPGDSILQE